jgi:hypothetical protein
MFVGVPHSIAFFSKVGLQMLLSLLIEGCNINKKTKPAK